MKRLLIASLFVFPVHANDVYVSSMMTITCAKYNEYVADNKTTETVMTAMTAGFMSGVSMAFGYIDTIKNHIPNKEDVYIVYEQTMQNYCRANPQKKVIEAALESLSVVVEAKE